MTGFEGHTRQYMTAPAFFSPTGAVQCDRHALGTVCRLLRCFRQLIVMIVVMVVTTMVFMMECL